MSVRTTHQVRVIGVWVTVKPMTTTTRRAIAAIAAKLTLGAVLVFTPHTHIANAAPAECDITAAYCPGDTLPDWPGYRVTEDDPRWNCIDNGNHVCGPRNTNGVPAGCYDDGGVLVAAWPCSVVVNPDGSSDVFTPDERH